MMHQNTEGSKTVCLSTKIFIVSRACVSGPLRLKNGLKEAGTHKEQQRAVFSIFLTCVDHFRPYVCRLNVKFIWS